MIGLVSALTLSFGVGADAEAWRAERPPVPPAEAPVLPRFERAELDNGLVLLACRLEGLPLVSLSLVTRGGSAQDPSDRPGLTSMAYDMLSEGTDSLSPLAFSDRVADFGARFGAGADRDAGSVSITGLARHTDPLLDLLAQAVRTPRLAPEDFQRLKKERLAQLQQQLSTPQGLAIQELPKQIYGADHPFGHPVQGEPESVQAMTVEEVRQQVAKVLVPGASALVAAGDVDLQALRPLAQRHFGDWTGPAPGDRSVPMVEPRARRQILVLPKQGLPQSLLMFGRPVVGRGHPDELPLQVLNDVFGGTFSSRLNMNLREDKGYTYGASTQVSFRNGVGVLLGYASVQAPHTGDSLRESFRELRELSMPSKNPPTEAEVRRAKDGVVRSLTGQFEQVGSVVSAASSIFIYDLPLNHLSTLGPRIQAVRRAEVLDVLGYFDPKYFQVVVVGDPAEVRRQMKEAGLGPVEVRGDP